jgi:hypothetical protein
MIKTAMEYFLNQSKHSVERLADHYFHITPTGAKEIKIPDREVVSPFTVNTLTGLVDYLNGQADQYSTETLFVHVTGPHSVSVFSTLNERVRDFYIKAEARVPHITFERFLETEQFNIMLQSCFEKTDDLIKILKIVGTVKEENVRTTGDDGVTQTVTAKAGIARYDDVDLPNPVVLVPYRTFMEVEQPASKFVFRMQDGPKAALFEADGGAWKLEAMQNIRKYLKDQLFIGGLKILA